MANPYLFNLTDDEALDVLYKLPPLCGDNDYLFAVYETLLAQYASLSMYICAQDKLRLQTEAGINLITEDSN